MISIPMIGLLILFISTGVFAPLLIEVITLNGGCEKSTLLVMLPGSLGMLSAIFVNQENFSKGRPRWACILVIAFLELFSQLLITDGLMLAGSATYTVAYSSVTIYTALLALIFLGKQLHTMQWMGIMFIVMGLAVVSVGAQSDGSDVYLGVLMILTGSISHACTYVLTEYTLLYTEDPVSSERLCFILGAISSSVNLTWQFVYTRPHFQTLVLDQIAAHSGAYRLVLLSYFVLTAVAGIHAITFYKLLGTLGSVSTGVCKGVQSVAIFIGSHFAFCSIQQSQCFTIPKAFSLVMVIIGVIMYSYYKLDHVARGSVDYYNDMRYFDDEGSDEESRSFLLQRIIRLSTGSGRRNSSDSHHRAQNGEVLSLAQNVSVSYHSVDQRSDGGRDSLQPTIIELPVIHHSLRNGSSPGENS